MISVVLAIKGFISVTSHVYTCVFHAVKCSMIPCINRHLDDTNNHTSDLFSATSNKPVLVHLMGCLLYGTCVTPYMVRAITGPTGPSMVLQTVPSRTIIYASSQMCTESLLSHVQV